MSRIMAEPVWIEGPRGRLEALLEQPPGNVHKGVPVGIICHPHPLFGGTLHNKVVHTIARAFNKMGARSLRFNFRGIGASAGSFGEGSGEIEDTLAVIAWVRKRFPDTRLWLGGFSFGGTVAVNTAQSHAPDYLVTIAPSVVHFNLNGIQLPGHPWLVIQGDEDSVVPYTSVKEWVDSLKPAPDMVTIKGAEHFFHGRLIEVREAITRHIERNVHSLL
ncbi:MAG: Dot/Icm type IV secretion system effector CoxH3 [Gammaproteobacteria bacterium]|nr:MAG: Dot/Icm type IV secretion system effector CoxH3 [Gammaproteobacteria bacterium]